MVTKRIQEIINQLRNGILSISQDDIVLINNITMLNLNKQEHNKDDIRRYAKYSSYIKYII